MNSRKKSSLDEKTLAQWRARIELHFEAQDWENCIELCCDFLALEPRNYYAQDVLSMALLQVGRVDEALEAVQRLLGISPRDPFHRLRLATLYQMQEKHGASAREFERIAAMYPDSPFTRDTLDAIETLDRLQTSQIFMMAAENPYFRRDLENHPEQTLRENDFHLSENSFESLRQMLPAPNEDAEKTPRIRFH